MPRFVIPDEFRSAPTSTMPSTTSRDTDSDDYTDTHIRLSTVKDILRMVESCDSRMTIADLIAMIRGVSLYQSFVEALSSSRNQSSASHRYPSSSTRHERRQPEVSRLNRLSSSRSRPSTEQSSTPSERQSQRTNESAHSQLSDVTYITSAKPKPKPVDAKSGRSWMSTAALTAGAAGLAGAALYAYNDPYAASEFAGTAGTAISNGFSAASTGVSSLCSSIHSGASSALSTATSRHPWLTQTAVGAAKHRAVALGLSYALPSAFQSSRAPSKVNTAKTTDGASRRRIFLPSAGASQPSSSQNPTPNQTSASPPASTNHSYWKSAALGAGTLGALGAAAYLNPTAVSSISEKVRDYGGDAAPYSSACGAGSRLCSLGSSLLASGAKAFASATGATVAEAATSPSAVSASPWLPRGGRRPAL